MEIISSTQAARMIKDDWWLIPGGFGCCGHPDSLTQALRKRFLDSGHPRNVNLLFTSGAGDRQGRGIDALALPSLVRKVIGGFLGGVLA